jgi:hypothetical protein
LVGTKAKIVELREGGKIVVSLTKPGRQAASIFFGNCIWVIVSYLGTNMREIEIETSMNLLT